MNSHSERIVADGSSLGLVWVGGAFLLLSWCDVLKAVFYVLDVLQNRNPGTLSTWFGWGIGVCPAIGLDRLREHGSHMTGNFWPTLTYR